MESKAAFKTDKNEQKIKRSRHLWFLLLIFIALVTSSILGFILGRQTGTMPLGQVVDTIVLEPEVPVFHLSGQTLYTDGSPAAGLRMQLHSEPIETQTDSAGNFLFPNVEQGEHSISVLSATGDVLAQREVQILRQNQTHQASVKLTETDSYVIELSVDVRVLEITIELDQGSLSIDPNLTFATAEGQVSTPYGTANISQGTIVTPQGNVYLTDGHVIFPGGTQEDPTKILLPDDQVIIDHPLASDVYDVTREGIVTLPDGTVIKPGGEIITGEGAQEGPGETGVIVSQQTVTPIGSSGEEEKPKTEPTPEIRDPLEPPSESTEAVGKPEPEKPEEEIKPTLPPYTDPGEAKISASQKDGSFTSWDQYRTLDLFYNPTTGQNEKIAPGSQGYYLFQLENDRQEKLIITLTFTKEADSPYLPLVFTLQPYQKTGDSVSGTLTQDQPLTLKSEIEADSTLIYRLDWQWPLDSGMDEADTQAGKQGGTYKLNLTLHLEGEHE